MRTRVLVIDNYDSFTYNLVQRLGEIDPSVELRVERNDQVTVEQIEAWKPSHLIISPGPCTPREAGISNEVVGRFSATIPILIPVSTRWSISREFQNQISSLMQSELCPETPYSHEPQESQLCQPYRGAGNYSQ